MKVPTPLLNFPQLHSQYLYNQFNFELCSLDNDAPLAKISSSVYVLMSSKRKHPQKNFVSSPQMKIHEKNRKNKLHENFHQKGQIFSCKSIYTKKYKNNVIIKVKNLLRSYFPLNNFSQFSPSCIKVSLQLKYMYIHLH